MLYILLWKHVHFYIPKQMFPFKDKPSIWFWKFVLTYFSITILNVYFHERHILSMWFGKPMCFYVHKHHFVPLCYKINQYIFSMRVLNICFHRLSCMKGCFRYDFKNICAFTCTKTNCCIKTLIIFLFYNIYWSCVFMQTYPFDILSITTTLLSYIPQYRHLLPEQWRKFRSVMVVFWYCWAC